MPLSEDEQRILTEIEHQLRASDPDLARQVGETTVYSDPLRRTRFALAGVVGGLVLLVGLLLVANAYVAFLGFLVMFVSAVSLERNLRHLGRVGMTQLANSVRGSGVRDMFGGSDAREASAKDPED